VAKKRHLQLLDKISVASPCNASWDEMHGDERVRFCGQCSKHVYNLSAMSAEEAATLVYLKEDELCVRFFRRRDGTFLTSDCPAGARRQRRRQLGLCAVVVAATATACAIQLADDVVEPKYTMGKLTNVEEL
jgi:hypothetical protein